jgi:hypothetical protein
MHVAKARLNEPDECCPDPPGPEVTVPATPDADGAGFATPPPHAAAPRARLVSNASLPAVAFMGTVMQPLY